ncbi:MAG: hypothetical protein M3441_09485 [Chloroflexota bacterium]|nr:hypothetical protein [Chloroflexota bacterium]
MKYFSRLSSFTILALLIALTPSHYVAGQSTTQTFPETGKTVKGRFLQYWQQNGGLPQQGYPITNEIQERSDTDGKTYTVQYFERAVFESHPENQKPHDVLLSLLGAFEYKARYGTTGAPGQKASTSAGARKFAETGKTVGGKFLDYWNKHGGLAQQGYPLTEEFTEVSALNGKPYTVQYFERAVFELHPENQPPFDVLLSQLGTVRYQARYGAASAGKVAPTASMSVPRAGHSATLLPGGKVLIAGGMIHEGRYERSAELFDPGTNSFNPTGSMAVGRTSHVAMLLPNGKVLVAGGESGSGTTAELYDPDTGTFTRTGDMNAVRDGATATLLKNGKVLIAGGFDFSRRVGQSSVELYDPATGKFTPTGGMKAARSAHTATLLPDGKVLIIAGGIGRNVLSDAETYDPMTGRLSPAGNLPLPRHKHTATLLPDGRVFITGGSDSRDWNGRYASSLLYDPAHRTFAPASEMSTARFKLRDAIATLPNGKVLVAGGATSVELYDPAYDTFNPAQGSLDTARLYQTATTLADGRVLIIGGYDNRIESTNKAWIYQR